MRNLNAIVVLLVSLALTACERAPQERTQPTPPAAPTPAAAPAADAAPKSAPTAADAGHEGHDHAPKPVKPGHSGESIELGTVEVAGHTVRASRDKQPVTAGGDSPVDVWIDESSGKNVTVVRLWIGTADAKGSLKAKADLEDGHWHTHVEIPDPLPAESKLWVEIEKTGAEKHVTSFDLKS